MIPPLFIATERFDPSDAGKWRSYCDWAKIPGLVEIASLDSMLCGRLTLEIRDEDWEHIVCEDYRSEYFHHLDYLLRRVRDFPHRNILGVYRNPQTHIAAAPGPGDFRFLGYDLIDEQTQISALVNCGGFPDVFSNEEINSFGLIDDFERASQIRSLLAERHPEEPHAQCELYAIWRLNEEPVALHSPSPGKP